MTGANWIRDAMSDDSLVAEALLQLHRADSLYPDKSGATDLKLEWSVRQRRTKAAPSRKKGDHIRASPTTPLSWSGATSFSGCGGGAGSGAAVDGFEESSGAVKPSETVRSKITQTSVTTTTPFKRSRKKKTLAELKEEESLLLKERKGLKSELSCMRDLLKQQRTRNEALKKMQAESQSILSCKPTSQTIISAHSSEVEAAEEDDSSFLLPDLNIPLDNDPNPEVIYGTS